MIYIFWTCSTQEEAKKIIHQLLDKQLIACGSIIPGVESLYRWQGKIEESHEVKVILKTVGHHFNAIEIHIKNHCSYKVPEIVRIDITDCNPDYLKWITEST